jgi:hypothetical protein
VFRKNQAEAFWILFLIYSGANFLPGHALEQAELSQHWLAFDSEAVNGPNISKYFMMNITWGNLINRQVSLPSIQAILGFAVCV